MTNWRNSLSTLNYYHMLAIEPPAYRSGGMGKRAPITLAQTMPPLTDRSRYSGGHPLRVRGERRIFLGINIGNAFRFVQDFFCEVLGRW